MAIHDDIPPPYSEVGTHGVFPRATHDERARFNFLANLNKHVAGTLGPGNKLAWEKRARPKFVAEHGRDGFLAAWLDHREVGWAADLIPTLTNKETSQ